MLYKVLEYSLKEDRLYIVDDDFYLSTIKQSAFILKFSTGLFGVYKTILVSSCDEYNIKPISMADYKIACFVDDIGVDLSNFYCNTSIDNNLDSIAHIQSGGR